MSNENRVGLAYVEETTFGETPSGPPTLVNLRHTSKDLYTDASFVQSQEIRSDRQVTDVIRTGLRAAGTIDGEVSYGAYDAFLEAALMSADWDSAVDVEDSATDVSAANADNSFNSVGGFDATPSAGQWIKVAGFTTAANNGYFRVVSATSNKIIVEGGTLTDEAAGDTVTIKRGARVVNGTTFRSFAIEKSFEDLSNEFEIFNGMFPDQLSLGITAEQVMTCQFTLVGKTGASATATAGDGSNTAAPTNDVMNAVDHVSSVLEALASFDIVSASIQLANNARPRPQVGTLGAVSIGTGTLQVTGTLQAYYASKALMDKFLNATESSLAFIVQDADGNAYIVDLPKVKFTSGKRTGGGLDTDVMADMGFTAYRHPTLDMTIQIARFAA